MDTGLHKKHKRHQFPEKRKYLPLGKSKLNLKETTSCGVRNSSRKVVLKNFLYALL